MSEEYTDSWVEARRASIPAGQLRVRGRLGPLPQGLDPDRGRSTLPPAIPVGVTDNSGVFTLAAGTQIGVYQKLSTRAGGEVDELRSVLNLKSILEIRQHPGRRQAATCLYGQAGCYLQLDSSLMGSHRQCPARSLFLAH